MAVAVGIVIRLAQFAWDRSLFIDEAALALNIRERSFFELTQRLDYAQSAPLGFLFLQKILWTILGDNTYVLRLPALAAGIAALVLLVPVAKRLLPLHLVPSAVALFAVSHLNIYWATDAKQYAFDVLSALVLLLLALRFTEQPTRTNAIRLGIAGAILPFFSLAVIIVMASTGMVLLIRYRHELSRLLPIVLLWLIPVPEVIRLTMSLSPEDKAYFKADWWDGFLPLPLSRESLQLYKEAVVHNLRDPVGYSGSAFAIALAIIAGVLGAAWLLKHRRTAAILLLTPVLVAWLLSLIGQYPVNSRWIYAGRVTLFLTPAAYLCIIGAAAWLRWRVAALSVALLLFLVAAVPAVSLLPYTRGEPKRAFEYVERNARPTDQVYLYYGTELAWRYYRPQIPGTLTIGVCSHDNPLGYYRDFERLRGNERVWLVMAQGFYGEWSLIIGYAEHNAVRQDARVHLYDFSTGKSEPLPPSFYEPIVKPNPNTACRGIFKR
jgi:hypothetical protein